MPHRNQDVPKATPATQSAPMARAGGTYGSSDFSHAARRSEFEIDQHGQKTQSPDKARAIARSSQVPPVEDDEGYGIVGNHTD